MSFHTCVQISREKSLSFLITCMCLAGLILALGSGCGGTSRSRGGNGAQGSEEPDNRNDIGDEVPPITSDKVSVLETGDSGALVRLAFESTGVRKAGRYLSEFLLVVRSNSDSCVRLKVRPIDGGTSSGLESTEIEGVDAGDEACGVAKSFDPEVFKPKADDEKKDGDKDAEEAQLHLAGLDFSGTTARAKAAGFLLTGEKLCDSRIFRMASKDSLESIHTKTGRLLHKEEVQINGETRLVRVWGDEEIARFTCSGSGMNHLPRIAYGNLWSKGFPNYYDRLMRSHVEALAKNTAASYKTLAEAFGNVSDVDRNQGLDVFITPEINRQYFYRFGYTPNQFSAWMLHKPEDLANYNAVSNPAGNEGEIVYLWAPDPAGIYRAKDAGALQAFPGSNSLTSNYARGYLGAQIMGLIIANEKLIVQKRRPEAPWLREALMLLASSYVGGNSYSLNYTTQYLSSRPQSISLTQPVSKDDIPERYATMAAEESLGMRAMFGWYLHSRLCGKSLAPCKKLTTLLQSEMTGIDALENVFESNFRVILEHFGLTVGVHLSDNPIKVTSLWDHGEDGLPQRPAKMPDLAKVNNGAATRFVHSNVRADEHESEDIVRVSGPFPSLTGEIFQAVLPDYDLDVRLAPHSVTYVLLTGLLEEMTEMTAALGPNLNVVFVPLGDRQTSATPANGYRRNRFIHTEKVSELAHTDLRPANLTSWRSDRTPIMTIHPLHRDDMRYPTLTNYYYEDYPELSAEQDTAVTLGRELWVYGSIDNFDVRVAGSDRTIGNTDSYTFEVNPCLGIGTSACAAKDYEVLIQLTSRDSTKDIDPMFLVGPTDLGFYRGKQLLGTVSDWSPEIANALIEDAAPGVRLIPSLCESSDDYGIIPPGVDDIVCATGGILAPGDEPKPFLDHHNYLHDGRFASGDNFLFSGAKGFPFFNTSSFYRDIKELDYAGEHLSFTEDDVARQFYNFSYSKDAAIYELPFYTLSYNVAEAAFNPIERGISSLQLIGADVVGSLGSVKTYLRRFLSDYPDEQDPESESFNDFLYHCRDVLRLGAQRCLEPMAHFDELQNYIKNTFIQRVVYVCHENVNDGCEPIAPINDGDVTINGQTLESWGLVVVTFKNAKHLGNNHRITTYYPPLHTAALNDPYCGGGSADPVSNARSCLLKDAFDTPSTDIRSQLPVSTTEFIPFCLGATCPVSNNHVYADFSAYDLALENRSGEYKTYLQANNDFIKDEWWYSKSSSRSPLLLEQQDFPLGMVAGEVIDKQRRMHALRLRVSGQGEDGNGRTPINVIVGGRDLSQGKYFLRIRVVRALN